MQTPLNRSSSKRERQSDLVGAAAATCAFLKSVFGTCPVSFYRSRLDALLAALLAASGLLKTLFVPPKQVSSAASDGAVAPSGQSKPLHLRTSTARSFSTLCPSATRSVAQPARGLFWLEVFSQRDGYRPHRAAATPRIACCSTRDARCSVGRRNWVLSHTGEEATFTCWLRPLVDQSLTSLCYWHSTWMI